jgi:hypothetical protein
MWELRPLATLRTPTACAGKLYLYLTFVYSAKYLGVIFDKKVTWKLHVEFIEARAFKTFNRIYSLFKSERLNTKVKLTLHKTLEYHDLPSL